MSDARAQKGELAVIGVLFQLQSGRPPAGGLLRNVFLNLRNATRAGTHAPTGALDMRPLVRAIAAGPLYAYGGSLTTPPCTEGVRWLVLARPRPLAVDTYNAVKRVMKFNARYSQNAPGGINLLEKARQIADGLGGVNASSAQTVLADGAEDLAWLDDGEFALAGDGDEAEIEM